MSFDSPGVLDQFPRCSKTRLGWLRLPEVQIKRPIQIGYFTSALNETASHGFIIPVNMPIPPKKIWQPHPIPTLNSSRQLALRAKLPWHRGKCFQVKAPCEAGN